MRSPTPGYVTHEGEGYEIRGGNHLAGTHVMGTSKANSVVDRNQRSWDHDNLYLVGGGQHADDRHGEHHAHHVRAHLQMREGDDQAARRCDAKRLPRRTRPNEEGTMSEPRITTVDTLHAYLRSAMQLEHATIPPYLMALYSIKPGTNSDASHVLRVVVVEEMLHLTLVANLLNAVGGDPDLTAPRLRAALPGLSARRRDGLSGRDPTVLEGGDRDILEHRAAGEGSTEPRQAHPAATPQAALAARARAASRRHVLLLDRRVLRRDRARPGLSTR